MTEDRCRKRTRDRGIDVERGIKGQRDRKERGIRAQRDRCRKRN